MPDVEPIIVFYRNKKEKIIERLAVARYNIGKSIQSSWDKEKEPSQWKALVDNLKQLLNKNRN